MKCPHCETHIDEHEASTCLDLWVWKDVFGWTTSIEPYMGDFYPEGSYFVIWHQPEDFMSERIMIISQAFDKDGNNLRSTEENPFGIWDETPGIGDYSLFFSSDGNAAIYIMEKMGGFTLTQGYLYEGEEKKWKASKRGPHVPAHADTAPLAICRVAIKATTND